MAGVAWHQGWLLCLAASVMANGMVLSFVVRWGVMSNLRILGVGFRCFEAFEFSRGNLIGVMCKYFVPDFGAIVQLRFADLELQRLVWR